MKVLVVFAHPEPKSLNGSLFKVTVEELKKLGHEVKTSDLYAMKWKSNIDAHDFPGFNQDENRLIIADESVKCYKKYSLTKDVMEEQEKIEWADLLIFQFPFWWYSMPAILKGWFDRVLANGFAYGIGFSKEKPRGECYGEGYLKGKRAMLSITFGDPETSYSERGIEGDIFDLLFPIQHGLLFYPGMDVLEPFLIYECNTFPKENYEKAADLLRERLKNIEKDAPIAFRSQNGGDYDKYTLELKPEKFNPKIRGLKIHLKDSE
ncbi:unnamed protein product [Ambrosiozyma monospora]|uniref:Unnamed protein product n=1 Tax=Ambrosiozyma monospora TaxID=43982 RepID=A0ACB5SXF4_AMBMO|nr:unnamed protein product [Ambrosiozyma monospora]